ncbi:efflux RND transporter permease subunit [Pelagicoccus mobilis]|uniref:Efflux RND transporter permease subunit n=1 Tax=Pelagicoccus mobilis TaxID=415221 RepID=A0A934S067_9BACT|nr:efflux RND transporter permease subunit [Pelagicoccus mobilis]MBK1878131.1 efflux RND transporter permease subunit [Pelagicoccus mobilis]
MIDRVIRFCLSNKLVVFILAGFLALAGLVVAPFDWDIEFLDRRPVPVDAIPDTGDNQQIVFTEWSGRSPQDIEDQITYPLTSSLLGLPGVKSIRSSSSFGFSSIYVIFEDGIDFYWSRSRILEKLSSLPKGTLPDGVQAQLGPDATALGQVFWYTLEGRDAEGRPAGGWDLAELRSVQDWYVRYALQGVEGVAEVAAIGGFVKEYQVDVDPDALRVYDVSIQEVAAAVSSSNLDVGARTIEINNAEYVVRGLGFVKSLDDLRKAVIAERNNVPITLEEVAEIEFGPALRRGALDKGGTEAVGGVVVARFGENPLEVIKRVKERIENLELSLPAKELADGSVSRLKIVPFYDRSGLIEETLDTLETAVRQQILVTVIVVILMLLRLRSAVLVSSVLPLAVLSAFVGMKLVGVDANIVALSGIAIAVGTIVDMAIVLVENCIRRLETANPNADRLKVIYEGCVEVGGAVLTSVLTTVVSFLPVFTMIAEEGRLFRPLAYTKTFTLLGSILVALTLIPALIHLFYRKGGARVSKRGRRSLSRGMAIALSLGLAVVLAYDWQPLGLGSPVRNVLFVVLALGLLVGFAHLVIRGYPVVLGWILKAKVVFVSSCLVVVLGGSVCWLGWGKVFSWSPLWVKEASAWQALDDTFPGLGREFMPALDEGSFLFMPTTMVHASIGEAMDVLRKQDMAIKSIPEVESVVGKIGRVESSLDPAPISMVETIISYKPEFVQDESGEWVRQWRDEIRNPEDIWDEIERVARIPGVTSAPMLQPIETRRIMLQTGLRASMGLKVFGPNLEAIDQAALAIESTLKESELLKKGAVIADRVVGKPYLEIEIDRDAIARYGITVGAVQEVIETAIGGRVIMQTVEGRERYPVRLRYLRERRDSLEAMERILVATPKGVQVPLSHLARIVYKRGPQMIKSEDTFLMAYVLMDPIGGIAEVDAVEGLEALLAEKVSSGELKLPTGVRYEFTGTYQGQVRAAKTLRLVLPVAMLSIWLLLYLQFRNTVTTFIVFSGVAFAWSGGFWLVWLYGQDWFLDLAPLGANLRGLFQVGTVNLSVAVWVGFLALFGTATDDGVLLCTYLKQTLAEQSPRTKEALRKAVIEAGKKRIRPAMMTSATTMLALLPVLTSSGRGADVMIPMAIPVFGGMCVAFLTVFFVPAVYCSVEEWKLRRTALND